MKEKICWLQALGFCVTALGGTLLHFLYEWTGGAVWAAPFSGVNESTWEHMKLLFWPMLVFAIVQSRSFRDRKDFWCVKLRGILLGLTLIPILFYTYNGAIAPSPDWLNIAIFFISAACRSDIRCLLVRVPRSVMFSMALIQFLNIILTGQDLM